MAAETNSNKNFAKDYLYLSRWEKICITAAAVGASTYFITHNITLAASAGLIGGTIYSLSLLPGLAKEIERDEETISNELKGPYLSLAGNGKLHFHIHHGRQKKTPDGTILHDGDVFGELTLSGKAGLNTDSRNRNVIRESRGLYRDFISAAIDIGTQIQTNTFPKRIKCITAVTHMGNEHLFNKFGIKNQRPDLITRVATASDIAEAAIPRNTGDSQERITRTKFRRMNQVWIAPSHFSSMLRTYQNLETREKAKQS